MPHALISATVLLLTLGAGPLRAAEPPAPEALLERVDAAQTAETSHAIIEQTIETTGGRTRTFTIESWSTGGGEKSVMKFRSPAPSAGIGMLSLKHGDNIWAYFPDSDDLRKIPGSSRNASMQGSDFNYEDMTMSETGDRYRPTTVEADTLDGEPAWRLTLEPRSTSPYGKVVSWIDPDSYVTHRTGYYDEQGEHIKTLTMSGWKQVSGVWTPATMEMRNLERGSKTTIRIQKIAYGVEIPDDKFTTAFLTTL